MAIAASNVGPDTQRLDEFICHVRVCGTCARQTAFDLCDLGEAIIPPYLKKCFEAWREGRNMPGFHKWFKRNRMV